ncbi:restriction endonuclease subunit S [Aerococcus urinaeequi]|uniref:restriction endonuclease subunit S n=1 Tax=Aerococcus urinaeequi TaxID=51665 RepID=UPI003D6A3F92
MSINKDSKKAPNLRFKGFTDDWEERKLGFFLTESRNIGTNGAQAKKLTVKLWGKGVIPKSETNQGSKSTQYYVRSSGQFIYGKLDFLNQAFGIIPDNLNGYESTLDSPAFDISKNLNKIFLLEYVSRESFYQYQGLIANGSRKAKRIHVDTFLNMPIKSPTNIEQEQIGNFIQLIDSTITLHQRKLDRLNQLKEALLQQMFPVKGETVPKLRFAGFEGDWEERKLGELSNIVGGGTPSTSNPEYWDGDIDWYAPAEIGEQSYVSKSKKTITELGLKKSSARILPVGTVLFTSRAGIGNTAILAKDATTNQGFQSIVPDKKKLDSYFIFSRTNELKRYGEVTGAGSTFVEVSGKQMSKMPIKVPVLSEQQRIGTFFKSLDDTITLQQRKLDQLKNTKQVLLQNMFI